MVGKIVDLKPYFPVGAGLRPSSQGRDDDGSDVDYLSNSQTLRLFLPFRLGHQRVHVDLHPECPTLPHTHVGLPTLSGPVQKILLVSGTFVRGWTDRNQVDPLNLG